MQGVLVALDLRADSPLLRALVHPGLLPLRTTYEGDFGEPLGDVYYFPHNADSGGRPVFPVQSLQGTSPFDAKAARTADDATSVHPRGLPQTLQLRALARAQQGFAALCSWLQARGAYIGAFF